MKMEAFHERLLSLEKRVAILESEMNGGMDTQEAVYADLSAKYGQNVDKSKAARIIGVTRATVYAMLKDGRLDSTCYGKRVSIKSIARYLAAWKLESI